jgi:flavorubredoxin
MLEVFHVQDMAYELGDPSLRQGNHSQDMLMAYLPKERILYNADLYSPPAAGAAAPAQTPASKTLYQNMLKLKLDVAQHVPTHGRVGTNEEFMKIFAKAGNTN